MVQSKLIKSVTFILFLVFVTASHASAIVPMKALCFDHKDECIRMRNRLDSRDQAPVYSYTHPCAREEAQLKERTRVNCRRGEWKLLAQLRSNYSEYQLVSYFSKVGYAPLRSSCVSDEDDAEEIIQEIKVSANCTEWRSVKDNYKIETSYRELSKSDMAKLKNKECENKRFLVEYKIKKTL